MNEWYRRPYIKRRDWMICEAEHLSLSASEMLLVMIIDYCNEYQVSISYDMLSKKMALSSREIDALISGLVERGYLSIYGTENGIVYDLEGLFVSEDERTDMVQEDLFRTFEDSFGRPLSVTEMQKLSDFICTYREEEIIDALRMADAYRKVNIGYIETILKKGSHESKDE